MKKRVLDGLATTSVVLGLLVWLIVPLVIGLIVGSWKFAYLVGRNIGHEGLTRLLSDGKRR